MLNVTSTADSARPVRSNLMELTDEVKVRDLPRLTF